MRLSAETIKTLELAAQEADALGSARIEPQHLLLAMTRQPGRAQVAFDALRLSPNALRSQILRTG